MARYPISEEGLVARYGPHLNEAPPGGWDAGIEVDREVKTHCCFCGQQCGIILKVKDNEVVGFEPWYEFPFNEGKLCPSVAIFISDPEQESSAPQEIVKALFDLTPAEAQLAMLLANGLTLDEASDALGISRNTARAHLRSTFSKTGVTRQTMLVRLILRSVATLG